VRDKLRESRTAVGRALSSRRRAARVSATFATACIVSRAGWSDGVATQFWWMRVSLANPGYRRALNFWLFTRTHTVPEEPAAGALRTAGKVGATLLREPTGLRWTAVPSIFFLMASGESRIYRCTQISLPERRERSDMRFCHRWPQQRRYYSYAPALIYRFCLPTLGRRIKRRAFGAPPVGMLSSRAWQHLAWPVGGGRR